MTNKEFLRKVSKLQKEFAELYGDSGLIGISNIQIQIEDDKFHELGKENLLKHISIKFLKDDGYWRHEAMTPDGIRVVALERVEDMEGKK